MLVVTDLSGNGKGVGFTSRNKVSQELEAVGRTASAQMYGNFNYSLSGTFVGTVRLEKSYNEGTTWMPVTAGGIDVEFIAPCEELFTEPEVGVVYSWNCTAYTSGTINARISQ